VEFINEGKRLEQMSSIGKIYSPTKGEKLSKRSIKKKGEDAVAPRFGTVQSWGLQRPDEN